MKETKAPLVLTVKGEAELVVQSAKAYQELLDRIRQIEEELNRAKLEALQSAIAVGVKQIESGEYVEYNEESLATLSEDIKARGRRRKQAQDGDAWAVFSFLLRQRKTREDIWTYIAQDSEQAADALIDEIIQSFPKLAAFPDMGRKRDDLLEGLHCFCLWELRRTRAFTLATHSNSNGCLAAHLLTENKCLLSDAGLGSL